jgi:hypothetical protein
MGAFLDTELGVIADASFIALISLMVWQVC